MLELEQRLRAAASAAHRDVGISNMRAHSLDMSCLTLSQYSVSARPLRTWQLRSAALPTSHRHRARAPHRQWGLRLCEGCSSWSVPMTTMIFLVLDFPHLAGAYAIGSGLVSTCIRTGSGCGLAAWSLRCSPGGAGRRLGLHPASSVGSLRIVQAPLLDGGQRK